MGPSLNYPLWTVLESLVKANFMANGAAVELGKFDALSEGGLHYLTLAGRVAIIGHKFLGSYAMGLAASPAHEDFEISISRAWPEPLAGDQYVTVYEIAV